MKYVLNALSPRSDFRGSFSRGVLQFVKAFFSFCFLLVLAIVC